MKPEQKPNVMKILNAYAGSHRHLITLGRILAAVTAFMGLVPFYDLWRIIRNKTVMVIAHRFGR